ncbi:MAG: 3-hydroxyisobutyrate dehydrogenase [Nocardioidaceae bacterium]
MTEQVAFIGLGNMGGPMAANLVRAGFSVRGFDPAKEAAESASAAGVEIADSAAGAAAGASTVLTMLPTGQHLLEVYESGVLDVLAPGALLIDSSTIAVADSRDAAGRVSVAGGRFIDAPVSGGVGGAEAGTLTFMVGGAEADVVEAGTVLEPMAGRIVHCGEVGAGQAAKICNNLILGITMVGVSEAFVLGERLGLTHQALFDVASTASGQCWALSTNCPVPGPVPTSPANRDYVPGFASPLMAKDLTLAMMAADETLTGARLGRLATDIYREFARDQGRTLDFSAVIDMVRSQHQDPTAEGRTL